MKKKLHNNQSGLVSFMVVLIIMLVLTLIVLAFAQLVRREQRQTLDRQLNSQAFYAAETGVNDARERLSTTPSLGGAEYDQCDEFITAAGLTAQSRIDGPTGSVSYSCLLVDPSPPELTIAPLPTDESVVWTIQPRNPATITRIELSWEDGSGGSQLTGCPAATTFPGQWPATCQIGILRAELVPFSGNRIRNDLINDRGIIFLQPSASGGSTAAAYASITGDQQGGRVGADCDGVPGPRRCTFSISGVSMTRGYIRMRSIYRSTAVTLRAFAGSTQVELVGAQASVDVTGKASDILKRIKTSVSVQTGEEYFPEFALQSLRTQCKRMGVLPLPGGGNIDVAALFDGPNSNCNPQQINNN